MFISNLDVRKIGKNKWKLLSPLVYDGTSKIIVPIGFETDFASVPRLVWWFCAPGAGNHRLRAQRRPAVLRETAT